VVQLAGVENRNQEVCEVAGCSESDRPALGKMNITSLDLVGLSLQPAEWQNFGRRGGRHPRW